VGQIHTQRQEGPLRFADIKAVPLLIAIYWVSATTGWAQKSAPAATERIGTATILVTKGPRLAADLPTNLASTLTYDWVIVNDSSLGLVFDGPAGARAAGTPDVPEMKINADVRALVPVAAYEIRVVTFDVWRRHTATLVYSRLQDIKAGEKKGVKRAWSGFQSRDVRLQLTSIVYIAKVRYQDGKTVVADTTPVLRAAQVISAAITAQDLEPTKEVTELAPTSET
jgi:hypothetical protein